MKKRILFLLALISATGFADNIPSNNFPRSFLLRYSCPVPNEIQIDSATLKATGYGEIDGCKGSFSNFQCDKETDWDYEIGRASCRERV